MYNVGQGRAFSLHDMAQAIRSRYPAARIDIGAGFDFMNVGFCAYNVLDISKAREQLGYVPEFDLPAMVEDYANTLERFGIRPTAT